MRDFNKELCYVMHKLMQEHIGELQRPIEFYGDWKDEKALLNSIKRNVVDAVWALTELCRYDLARNHELDFLVERIDEDGFDIGIYKIVDRDNKERFFKVIIEDYEAIPIEVKRVTKMVEITTWEKL
jgi:hypothetical protein